MKNIKIFILAGLFAITAAALFAFINLRPAGNSKTTINKGFAVIELFTSEGCSSCPPADELAARVQKEYNDKPVYILAFHVDYWNRLGWKDVFSSAEFSKRQNEYARYLNISSVYTPQIVVNGKKEFIGSENGTLHNAIKAALLVPSPAQLILSDVKTDRAKATIHYEVNGSDNSVLLIALVQKMAQSHVKAGENNGRTLSHLQIVRKLQSTLLKHSKNGTAIVTIPNDFKPQDFEIIGLLQNTANGEITAAAKAVFWVNNNAASKT